MTKLISKILIALPVAIQAQDSFSAMEEPHVLFDEFKKAFKKVYATPAEELKHLKYFIHNMKTAAYLKHTEQGTATYGHLSPLADMSEEAYRKLNNLPVTPQLLREHEIKASAKIYSGDLPENFDWRDKNAVTDVKNQGQCGSCWAFATVANIESNNVVQGGELISLSEQELVDCSESDGGCNGGLPSRAYADLINSKSGLEKEGDYGYHAKAEKCNTDRSKEVVFLSSWHAISRDETQIAVALMQYGALALGLNASPMQMYTGGISDPWFCSPSGIDHAVTLTGFGTEDGKDFWSIKNSWSASWGEKGYYRLIRGKGKCGMNLMVTSAVAAPSKIAGDVYV